MKVLELKGYKSLRALNAFNALMLGLKMLPAYHHFTYEDFFATIQAMNEVDQANMIREAANFVELQKEEVEALISFCADANGVPYGPENLANLNPKEILEIIVSVCVKISQIKIDLVTKDEKKNLKILV